MKLCIRRQVESELHGRPRLVRPEKPLLVIVSGAPGSGKSTLARALAEAVGFPVVSRDEIYEEFVQNNPRDSSRPIDTAQLANTAFNTRAHALLIGRTSVIVEAAFQHRLWVQTLESLLPLAKPCIVRCNIEPERALQRMLRRLEQFPERRAVHQDRQYLSERVGRTQHLPPFEHLSMNVPIIDVDTTDGHAPALDVIAAFISSRS